MTSKAKPGAKKAPRRKAPSKAAQDAKAKAQELKNETKPEDQTGSDEQVPETIVEAAERKAKEDQAAKQEAANAVEAAKSAKGQTKDAPDDGFFYLNKKPMYWRNVVSVPDVGRVSGQVKKAHFKAFFARAPKDLKLENWLAESDLVKERISKAKKKMKAKVKGDKE